MAKAKRKKRAKKATPKPTRIPKALRTEARRMRETGKIPRRLIDSLPQDVIDDLFPDLDEADLYE